MFFRLFEVAILIVFPVRHAAVTGRIRFLLLTWLYRLYNLLHCVSVAHSPFPPKQSWKFTFSEIRTCSSYIKSVLQIHFFRDLGMPHFHSDRFGYSLFLECGMPHFQPNNFGNSFVLESWHASFPPKQICDFNFSEIRTRPISHQIRSGNSLYLGCRHAPFPQTDLAIFFC